MLDHEGLQVMLLGYKQGKRGEIEMLLIRTHADLRLMMISRELSKQWCPNRWTEHVEKEAWSSSMGCELIKCSK